MPYPEKQLLMDGTINRSCHRAGVVRSLTGGGLTRGRGMTERQPVIWLLSMPAYAEMKRAALELTGVSYSTSDDLWP